MDYLTAAHTAAARLGKRPRMEVEDQACLLLVGQAGMRMAGRDPVWDPLAFDLLTVVADLYPSPVTLKITADGPRADTPALRVAVADLARALADRYDELGAAAEMSATRQFALAAAAAYLREAARRLR